MNTRIPPLSYAFSPPIFSVCKYGNTLIPPLFYAYAFIPPSSDTHWRFSPWRWMHIFGTSKKPYCGKYKNRTHLHMPTRTCIRLYTHTHTLRTYVIGRPAGRRACAMKRRFPRVLCVHIHICLYIRFYISFFCVRIEWSSRSFAI